MKKKILVLGAQGNLARFILPDLNKIYNVISIKKKNLHLYANINKILNLNKPDYILNLAANTNLRLCENKPIQAYNSNFKVIKNLSDWQKKK